MNKYKHLLEKFIKVKHRVKSLIDEYPPEKREQILFDKWSLKDVIAHLNTWMEDDLRALKNLKGGKKSYWEPDIDAFNAKGVDIRKNRSWSVVYKEFDHLVSKLIETYETLPEELYEAQIWGKHKGTPMRSLQTGIEHWEEEHIPSLESNLK